MRFTAAEEVHILGTIRPDVEGSATMLARGFWRPGLLAAVLFLTACGPGAPPMANGDASRQQEAAAPKRVKAAIMGSAHTMYQKLNISNGVPGIEVLDELAGAGLARPDPYEELQALLAETVPSLANGLWQVFPDGRMETTWKLRRDAKWHDGAPFTAEDVLFTTRIERDRELPQFRERKYEFIESVEAPDSHTVVVKWREPYFEADQPFGVPLPAHILQEPASTIPKPEFVNLAYWTEEFVGTGPYRVREFERGSHVILEAFDAYFLGRPKIDVIDVRFIPDPNTLLANVFAGDIELTLGRTFSPDQALDARTRWSEGRVEFGPSYLHRIVTQLINPNPAIIGDVPFRQALYYAMDRQQISDSIFAGMTTVPRSVLVPNQPQYREIEPAIPGYDFDPRRAAQLIQSLGYAKGVDGFFVGPGGQRLGGVELRATAGDDSRLKILYAVADQWQRAGVGIDILVVPTQQNQDREYRARRPGFILTGGSAGVGQLLNFTGAEVPTRDNNWLGLNYASWVNPRYDDLYARYLVTIPRAERNQLITEMMQMLALEVPLYPVLFQVDATAIGNRITGVTPFSSTVKAWNAHLWDVKK
jgi:peptide/nickel transport system substrate-binding protein